MKQYQYLLKQAWLSLRKSPGFIFSVTSTIGLTMGALLAILTLAWFMVVEPLPYPHQERLVKATYQRLDQNSMVQTNTFIHPAAEQMFIEQSQTKAPFSQQTLLSYSNAVLQSEPSQPKLNSTYVTPDWFAMLAIPMAKGRGFSDEEGIKSFVPGAVLSHHTWQQQFAGRPDILEQSVNINGVNHPIIGVVAKSFIEPQLYQTGHETDLWLPWDYNNSEYMGYWGLPDDTLVFVGKLAIGETALRASQQVSTTANELFANQTNGAPQYAGWTVNVDIQPLKQVLSANSLYTVFLLLAGVSGLLMIAISNIANLFLARTVGQQRQLAICAALGAKKFQLVRALFSESLILMMLSTVVALIIAQLGFALMQHQFAQTLPRVQELRLTLATVSFAVAIALSLAWFFAWLGARMINYRALNSVLQSSGKGTGVQVSKKAKQWLIGMQVSIASMLVFANSVLINDAFEQLSEPLGFEPEQVISMEFNVATMNWMGWGAYVPKVRELEENLLLQPEVANVTFGRSPLEDVHQFPVADPKTDERYYPFHRNVESSLPGRGGPALVARLQLQ